jgi:hypothetical protein
LVVRDLGESENQSIQKLQRSAKPFRWNRKRTHAAYLLSEGALTDVQIVEKIGIDIATLWRWRQRPEFIALVNQITEDRLAKIHGKGLVELANRVDALNERWRLLQQIREERAQAMEKDAPGSSTGLLTRTVRQIGHGNNAYEVEEYQLDTGLLKELREHEKQAAQELGQWTEKTRVEQGPIEVEIVWTDEYAHT